MEEDIKILEQFLIGNKYCEDCKEKCVDCYIEYEEVQAVANLINRVKELEDYLNERIASVEKCYQDLIKPYKNEFGINTSLMTKKEKEEFINKRNCLLVQKHCYKEVLQELLEDK